MIVKSVSHLSNSDQKKNVAKQIELLNEILEGNTGVKTAFEAHKKMVDHPDILITEDEAIQSLQRAEQADATYPNKGEST